MQLIATSLAFFSFAIFSAASLVGAAPLTDEETQAFQWFDTLGFPKLEGTQWVRVASGQWSQRPNRPRENSYFNTFLLKVDGNRFSVFSVDGSVATFTGSGDAVSAYQRVGYEPRDLEADAKTYLETLRHPPTDEREWIWQRFGERISQRAEAFIMARGCAAHDLNELAHDLCAQAEAMPDRRGGDKDVPFIKRLSNDFAYSAIWKAFLDFGDPKIARSQLLTTFRDFVAHFPDCEYAARARETVEILERMTAEDQAHAKVATRPADQTLMHDRIAELIFQLRDQHGRQWSQPGACDIFLDERGEKSPASQLVAIGLDAVPQLIDALNDDRCTRSVGYHRNFYFSHFVLRVGDCAEAILSRIACRPFWISRTTSGAMLKDGQLEDTRRQVRHWWEDVQREGERAVLVDAVAAGDEKASEQAGRLVEKYPDAALEAIAQGVAKTQSEYLRVELVEFAGQLKGDSALPFLKTQLAQGASIDVRVAAAGALRARGDAEALPAMIGEWRRQCEGVKGDDAGAPGSLVQFLMSSDDPIAIHALKDGIHVWSVSSRLEIVQSLGEPENSMAMASGSGLGLNGARPPAAPKPATLDAIEDLLIAQLSDTEERGGMTGSIGDDAFTDPRICDMAAHSLAARWKERYTFKFSAPQSQRDRQRVIIENTWRTRHNLQPIPVPQPRNIQPVPHEQIDPLLQLLASPAEATRKRAIGDIEALGLGALPMVRQTLSGLGPEDTRVGALTSLTQRLSCRAEQVEIAPAETQFDGDLKAALDALKGHALSGEAFARVLVAFASKPPQGVHGLKLYATREDDFTGVSVRVVFVPGKFDESSDWEVQQSVSAGGEGLLGSFGSASLNTPLKLDGWDDLTRSLTKALTSSPETPFEVRVLLLRK
jgi:hypothetical protein